MVIRAAPGVLAHSQGILSPTEGFQEPTPAVTAPARSAGGEPEKATRMGNAGQW